MSTAAGSTPPSTPTPEYSEELHAEAREELRTGEHRYRYRLIDGVVMPPYVTPSRYALSRTLDTRADDVCCTSFPKSGTNWLANVILRLLHGGEVPAGRTLRDCLHWVESSIQYPRTRAELEATPSPRLFTSHMPFDMALGGDPLASPARYVYIARNPKDVVVSYFHFEAGQSWSGHYDGDWPHWLRMFVDGKLQRGDWFDHVTGWWRRRNEENVHFLTYEGLKRDFAGELRHLADFLKVELSPELARVIEERTRFRNMSQDRFSSLGDITELSHFYRKGAVGSWKERFTVSESEWFDQVYQQRMQGTDLEFVYE